jgi:hypothetical protein
MSKLDTFMQDIGLTQDQLQNKKTYIGGSSAKDIADGNWMKVYKQIALGESDDLSRIFKVQLGHITEEFNLLWFADENDWIPPEGPITEVVRNKDHLYIGCLPDSIMSQDGKEAVIDAKHTAAKAPWWDEEKVAEYYFPQAQHNMIATGVYDFYLSVIFGNEGPVSIHIPYDAEWAAQYITLCTAFWGHVERKDPPDADTTGLKVPEIALDDMRKLDMTDTNMAAEWGEWAKVFSDTKISHTNHEDSKKALKKLIPDDVKEATGSGIVAKRDKRGVTIKEA